jgi:hypothetical protein
MTELGNTSLTKLLRDGAVKVTVDPKFPQAIGLEWKSKMLNTILRAKGS